MKVLRSWGACLLLTLAPSLAGAAPPEAPETALVGATIHQGEGPGGTVLLSGAKIRAIGKVELAADTKVVNLKGHHLYPGLIDADTVLGLTEIGSVKGTQDTREVGLINPNLRAERAVNPDSILLPVARTGGVLFAHVAPRSGWIAGTSALIYNRRTELRGDDRPGAGVPPRPLAADADRTPRPERGAGQEGDGCPRGRSGGDPSRVS